MLIDLKFGGNEFDYASASNFMVFGNERCAYYTFLTVMVESYAL